MSPMTQLICGNGACFPPLSLIHNRITAMLQRYGRLSRSL